MKIYISEFLSEYLVSNSQKVTHYGLPFKFRFYYFNNSPFITKIWYSLSVNQWSLDRINNEELLLS